MPHELAGPRLPQPNLWHQFSVPPGVHAQDTEYTFYNGPGTNDAYMTYNATVAQALQQYIISFTKTGTPNGGGEFPTFPAYGNGTLLHLTASGLPEVRDPTANQRCQYFQRVPDDNTSGNAPPHLTATNSSNPAWGSSFLGSVLAGLVAFIAL